MTDPSGDREALRRLALANALQPAGLREALKEAVTKHCHINMKWPATAVLDDSHVEEFTADVRAALSLPEPAGLREAIDPADLWDNYCAEVEEKDRSPQGAMAFAADYFSAPAAPVSDRAAIIEECARVADATAVTAGKNYGASESAGALMAARRIRALVAKGDAQ